MKNLLTAQLVRLDCHYFARGVFPKFRQNLSVAGPLRVLVRKFRKVGRPTCSKKGLIGEVFWASNRYRLSDLDKIWCSYGHYGPPSSAGILPETATRWRRNRKRVVFLDGSCCTCARALTCGSPTVKFGWKVAEISLFGEPKPFWIKIEL